MRKEKITVLSRRTIRNPLSGGAGQYAHEIFRRLSKSYEVTILGEGSKNSPKSETVDGVNYVHLRGPLTRTKIVLHYLFNYSYKTDLLVDHSDVAIPWFSPLFAKMPRITLVHQLVKEIYYYQLRRPLADIAFQGERRVYKLYSGSRVVTSSESTAQELVEIGIPNELVSVVIPGYANHTLRSPSLDKREKGIACVSRLVRYKGIQFALRAHRKLLNTFPDAIFRIAGSGPYESALKELSRDLGITSNVQFLGRITQDNKFDLLSRSRVAVFPSVRDGYGISIIEANSVGTPVVAWNVPGPRDPIVDGVTGSLVSFPDIDAFSDKMELLLGDDETWNLMSASALKTAANLSWDRSAREFSHVVESLLQPTAHHY